MIPIGDDNDRRHVPFVTWGIILLNVLVWLYEVLLPGPSLDRFIAAAALIPARVTQSPDIGALFTVISSMFLHGGWLHIIGNMLYLAIFGDNIEDRFGHIPYLLFYLLGGAAAAIAQISIDPGSEVPMLGASGAIAAVLGAYLVIFPRQRVRNLIIFFGFIRVATLPAIIVLGLWFVLQLFSGVASITSTASGGTAYFAHIGGFVFGIVIGIIARWLMPSETSPYFIPR